MCCSLSLLNLLSYMHALLDFQVLLQTVLVTTVCLLLLIKHLCGWQQATGRLTPSMAEIFLTQLWVWDNCE